MGNEHYIFGMCMLRYLKCCIPKSSQINSLQSIICNTLIKIFLKVSIEATV